MRMNPSQMVRWRCEENGRVNFGVQQYEEWNYSSILLKCIYLFIKLICFLLLFIILIKDISLLWTKLRSLILGWSKN